MSLHYFPSPNNVFQHVATIASLARADEYVYPKEKIDECWERVLLNQCGLQSIFIVILI